MTTLRRVAALAALAVPQALLAQTTVTTEATAGVHSFSAGFGQITYGQTFQVPNATDVVLQSFRMSAGNATSPSLTARLAIWDGVNDRMGTILWTGAGVVPSSRTYLDFDIGATLAVGTTYVFAYSYAANGQPLLNFLDLGATYAGGHEVYIGSTTEATLTGNAWNQRTHFDNGFTAQFVPGSVVPEPATVALLATGLLAVGGIARRRRGR